MFYMNQISDYNNIINLYNEKYFTDNNANYGLTLFHGIYYSLFNKLNLSDPNLNDIINKTKTEYNLIQTNLTDYFKNVSFTNPGNYNYNLTFMDEEIQLASYNSKFLLFIRITKTKH